MLLLFLDCVYPHLPTHSVSPSDGPPWRQQSIRCSDLANIVTRATSNILGGQLEVPGHSVSVNSGTKT